MTRLWQAFGMGLSLLWAGGALAAAPQSSHQAALDSFAKNLGYRFTLLSNKVTEGCPAAPVQQYCFSATLDLTMPRTMPAGDWSLYLGFTSSLMPIDSDAFTLTSGNGALHRLVPKPGMVKPGTAYRLKLSGTARFFSPFILLPNVYVAQEGLKPRIIAATRPKLDPASKLEELPFITPFTDEAPSLPPSVPMTPPSG